MKTIRLADLQPAPERAARFQGADFGADTSFFVAKSPPGRGVNKHRHPYEEILIVLNGDIEIGVNDEKKLISPGNAIIVPPKAWHEFNNKADHNALIVTIHNSPKIIQEDWQGMQ